MSGLVRCSGILVYEHVDTIRSDGLTEVRPLVARIPVLARTIEGGRGLYGFGFVPLNP